MLIRLGACGLAVALCVGCYDSGMQKVTAPGLLVAPADKAVLAIVGEESGGAMHRPVVNEAGHCVGWADWHSWFTANLPGGEQYLFLRLERDFSYSLFVAKLDLAAGKTYFLRSTVDEKGNDVLTPVRPGTAEWDRLDHLLKGGQQNLVDRPTCDGAIADQSSMEAADWPNLQSSGKTLAQNSPPILAQTDGVVWKGSALASAPGAAPPATPAPPPPKKHPPKRK